MQMEVESINGRRATDKIGVTPAITPVVAANNTTDTIWIILATIFVTGLAVAGIAFIYYQSSMNALRASYELQLQKEQNTIQTLQMQQQLQPTKAP